MARGVQRSFGHRLIHFLAFGFGAGAMPVAPGTFGTLVGVAAYVVLQDLSPMWYVEVVLFLFLVGVWLCHVTGHDLRHADHPGIVWDEIVGYLIAMFAAPQGWVWIVLGFGLFRLFDVWKPYPIGALERRVHGGFGTMLDDALAGVFALVSLQLIAWAVDA